MVGILEFTTALGKTDRSIPLRDGDSLVIGRSPDADVSFVDFIPLARQHCRVWAEGGQAWIESMGCRGNILPNRNAIRGPCVLRLGDEVRLLGELTFRLQPCPGTPTAEAESPTLANVNRDRGTEGTGRGQIP